MKRIAAVLLTLATVACHSKQKAPTPLAKIDLPAGAALKPWDASKQSAAWPGATEQLNGTVWVALANLYNFLPAGPGLLVGLTPSVGIKSVIDLGGSDEHQCQNPAAVKAFSGKLYVSCGPFLPGGAGVAEVDPVAGKVTRFVATPDNFVPLSLAVTAGKVWLGDGGGGNVLAIDRATFAAGAPASLNCTSAISYVPAMLAVGNDLFAFCSDTDGYLVRLDATTGNPKGAPVLVGVGPIAIAQTYDGRLAVANSRSGTLTLVSVGASTMTVAKDVLKFENSTDLEDIKSLDQFLYVMSAGTQNIIKVQLSGATASIVDAVNVNPGGDPNSNPIRVEVLDDDTVIVADSGLNRMIGVQFGIKKAQ